MSKMIKSLLTTEYKGRVEGFSDAAVISIRGVNAKATTEIRNVFASKRIRITVMRNSLARRAFEGTELSALEPLLTGPNALVYGSESVVDVAREIMGVVKKFPTVEIRGAVLDGELFVGKEGVERLSKFPTREEAIAKTVTLILSPARNLASQVKGPGSRVAGLVKTISDKLEKGEAIAAVS